MCIILKIGIKNGENSLETSRCSHDAVLGIWYRCAAFGIPTPRSKKLVCNEGKLLSQVTGQGSVYTKVNGLSCAYEKGILIISDNKSRVAINEYQ